MEYDKITTILKRYSFEEKIRICHGHSRDIMTPDGILPVKELIGKIMPWYLESFFLFAITANEWKFDCFIGKNLNEFYEIIECISSYIHPKLMDSEFNLQSVDYLLPALSAIQFDIQSHHIFKAYRFYFYFNFSNNKIDMGEIFHKWFDCDYEEFLILGIFLWQIYASKAIIPESIIKYIAIRYKIPFSHLTIDRNQYVQELSYITTDNRDYQYCFRPSYTYPFVSYNNVVFLPLPHLIMRATTSSLIYRITEGDNDLMTLIGKNVYEQYLYKIINESNSFESVFSEIPYEDNGVENWSIDVMSRQDTEFFFFDCKAYSPKIDIRTFSNDSIDKAIDRLADYCKQMYEHLKFKFPVLYNPFKPISPINNEHVWGIIVLQENPFIRNDFYYERAASKLGISLSSPEYSWLRSHIGITDIHQIERCCFVSEDFLFHVSANKNSGRFSDYWFSSPMQNNEITSIDFLAFKKKVLNSLVALENDFKINN